MSSSKEYLDYILEQLSEAEDISHRAMMGEYILYCREKPLAMCVYGPYPKPTQVVR